MAPTSSLVTAAVLCGSLLVPVSGLVAATPAQARQRYPSAGDVQRAQAATAATATAVEGLRAALDEAAARLAAARVAAEQAAESFDAARVRQAELTQVATLAAAGAGSADAAAERARGVVGALAAQDYRGGRPSLLDVLFTADDAQDLLDATTALDIVARGRVSTLRSLVDARAVATAERDHADAALDRAQAATAALRRAQQQAAARAADAATALAVATGAQERLAARLAGLQHVSVALAEQRRRGLALEARQQAAAEAAARQRLAEDPGRPDGAGPQDGPQPVGVDPGGPRGSAQAGLSAVAWARGQLGLPYEWGGAGPATYDCSGLTMRAWERAGVELPHYAASQYSRSGRVPYEALRPGDLIFYATDTGDPASIHHVALYAGGGLMIEAPYTGATVRLTPVRWRGAMPWAGRP